jgi:beta-lactam-binding protein with PASTA domain
MLEQAATAKLGELKLNVQILTAFDDNNVGRVVNQDPPPGDLQEGATVKLTIGRSTTAKT